MELRGASDSPRRFWVAVVARIVIFAFSIYLAIHTLTYLRAAGLLLRIENPQVTGGILKVLTHPVDESTLEVPTAEGAIRARLYTPRGISNPPGMLVVHGVHHLGIDDPRLIAFAHGLSETGIKVLTPEIRSLTDYHVDPEAIEIIGEAARSFSQSTGQKVGLFGISFGGGLSLLAAANPRYEPYILFVVSVGAHDDLERVSRFFITNQIARPDGTTFTMAAHEYGSLILIYTHLEDFFPAADLPVAHDALRQLLWENVDASREYAAHLDPVSRQLMESLYRHDAGALHAKIEEVIDEHRAEMAVVSPHGHLQSLRVPVFLLHGAADNVVPPSEELWLQKDVPSQDLRSGLVSPVISHVSLEGKPTFVDNFRLVHFMAEMLALVDSKQESPTKPTT